MDDLFSTEQPADFTTALQIAFNTVLQGGAASLADRLSMSGTVAPSGGTVLPVGATAGALPVFPMISSILGGTGIRSAVGAIGTAIGGAVGVLRSAAGRILGFVLPSGKRVTRKAAVAMAKQFGLVAAASALGASVEDLAQAVLEEEAKPRRRRGISAREMSVTTRTMGKVERMHRKIAQAARRHTR